jgi:hypothetical protein
MANNLSDGFKANMSGRFDLSDVNEFELQRLFLLAK